MKIYPKRTPKPARGKKTARRRASRTLDRSTRTAVTGAVVALNALLGVAGWIIVEWGMPAPEKVWLEHQPVAQVASTRIETAPLWSGDTAAVTTESPLAQYMAEIAARPHLAVQPAIDVEAVAVKAEPVRVPRSAFSGMIRDAARRHSLPPALVEAVARVESGFDPLALSHKGARGLLQVMPETGKRFGVQPEQLFDPKANLSAGTAYLAWLLDRFQGNLDLALAAYNAGEGAVDRHNGIPPYKETRNYVQRVRAILDSSAPQTPRRAESSIVVVAETGEPMRLSDRLAMR